ncbi:MAG: YihY/virulence factor BrkB family protein [Desulfosarcinaceae bacterium]
MQKLQSHTERIVRFLQEEIWRLNQDELSTFRSLLLRVMRVLVLTLQGFVRDNCALRASALTFYTLLSVVPVVAMAFGIAKGFGFEQLLESQLYQRLAGQEEVVARIIAFARSLLENTKGGIVAGIGVAVLFWSALKVLGHIEEALNEIWKVKPRSFIRRLTDYMAVMILSPVLVIVSSSMNVYITTEVKAITGRLSLLQMASPVIYFLLKLLPFGLIWILFILIYMVMPNTRVRFKSALVAGLVGGTIFQLFQGAYINAQVVVSKYNAIYGSFAALPLFLIWLQLSWMLVLFGAQVAYAHQHVGNYTGRSDQRETSPASAQLYAVWLVNRVARAFEQGKPAPTAENLAESLQIPFSMVADILDRLSDCGVLSVICSNEDEQRGYQPASDIHRLTIADVVEAWDGWGQSQALNGAGQEAVAARLEQLHDIIRRSDANCLVKDL